MEMNNRKHTIRWLVSLCIFFLSSFIQHSSAQVAAYSIKNGRMFIQMQKGLNAAAVDSFIALNELEDLDLPTFIKTNRTDSLKKLGWQVEINNESFFIISRAFEPFDNINSAVNRMLLKEKQIPLFPATNNGIIYGINKFRNKFSFSTNDSIVTFFLRNNKNADRVMLAGSFNNWNPENFFMTVTDSGWIAFVKLGPGKYWYKFIVDGNWTTDNDNQLKENDGLGNMNSVYFKPNVIFALDGYTNAKKVFLAGSFNGWKQNELPMNKTPSGWTLPLYLTEGTHTYKFIVDGKWLTDAKNSEKLPDGNGDFNSVLRFGKPHLFQLKGFENAKTVSLSGSFNGWKKDELIMTKTSSGWELPYTLGPGNYEYKYIVDGKWVSDPDNPRNSANSGNSFLIIEPNYTFRLKGFKDAKNVFLAGDFNNWDPKAYAMKKEGDEWIFPVHLFAGKHLYKFVIDGKWITDPANSLWEQNEYDTGNSVLWIDM
jgi:Glycogen recognition site of AMP-activated protein kinase